jgi:amino acid transporter
MEGLRKRRLNANNRGVSRYDGWWLLLIGSMLEVLTVLGLLGTFLNVAGLTFLPYWQWAIVGAVGILFLAGGLYWDKPQVARYHQDE